MIYYLRMALDNGKNVVVVLEGKYLTKIKERKIWRRYERNSVKVREVTAASRNIPKILRKIQENVL